MLKRRSISNSKISSNSFSQVLGFDRPYWDSRNAQDKYTTSSVANSADVREYFQAIKDNRYDSNDSVTLTQSNNVKRKLCQDSISPLFSYPSLHAPISSTAMSHRFDDSSQALVMNMDRRHAIKRNMYSNYTEQRIKFGLKF